MTTTTTSDALANAITRCKQRGIVIPTFAQMRDPSLIPQEIRDRLKQIGLWDVDPLNLFRISWKNEPTETGGGFGGVNYVEFPSSLTGVDAKLVGLVGKWFPTGAHKVGAGFGCLIPRLITGEFDPLTHKAVWPSTGNFCRGGAFDCALLGCDAVAILPEGMSRERFEWLKEIGAEIIATPGSESNVKEIYDACWDIKRNRPECIVFNQFEEFGNPIWHYNVTGPAFEDAFNAISKPGDRLAAYVSATGSGGTIAAGDYLKTIAPHMRIVAVEALQCPTILNNGFGEHRIEGIGDKHIPWVHNVRNTDAVAAIDDQQCIDLMRLFNEPDGKAILAAMGVDEATIGSLPKMGISSICNMVAAIKTAKQFDMDSSDVITFPMTDSMDLYASRLEEESAGAGAYEPTTAARHYGRWLEGIEPDHYKELTYADRKAVHNLKYFTWVEQQQRDVEDLRKLWDPQFWAQTYAQASEWDRDIEAFNARVASA